MRLVTILTICIVSAITANGYPMTSLTDEVAMDKRDLHDFCGGWFCGHPDILTISQ
ncbi:hypothetical protein K493DRAFT_364242 [Basidiobolus meristosporus CBS 931.73]|uniref:Uncharacterized protein n=1 Tax=Basidiobolus meristosporus CBS 931.73 TaxID=1314790 RepID=A0A1Y1WJ78_9FUNG|nr:hypothetical protein K493DRAFT_364242 [Basidiobolus meristosporus CBS 931.73]|eukprot:ORX73532.1 hypothetical protein K493DRAFT_364242 [Basidiobolus meristosporus CBS 931.73]